VEDFIYDLVSVDKVEPRLPKRADRRGLRLQALYNEGKPCDTCKGDASSSTADPWNSAEFSGLAGILSDPGDEVFATEASINLGDFIYLDPPDVEDVNQQQQRRPDPRRDGMRPSIVVLLASVAFSIILSFIAGMSPSSGSADTHILTSVSQARIPML
jgi:hypothetical protein